MTDQELGSILLQTNTETFIFYSMVVMSAGFVVKIFTNSNFDNLKIIASIIYISTTLYISFELYKIDTKIKLTENIILVKNSNLPKSEIKQYVSDFEKDIKSIEGIYIRDLILGLAKFMLIGMILLLVIEFSKFILIRIKKKKHNKALEEEQVTHRHYGNFKY